MKMIVEVLLLLLVKMTAVKIVVAVLC